MTVPEHLYPFAPHFLDRGGPRLHYLDEGSGEPVLMVHGNPTWSFYYRDLVRALRDRYRVVVPDHIGCGLSDKPGDDHYRYTLASRIEDLEALLDALGIDQGLTLVVHDWGGMIGMAVAVRRPQLVRRLVILNTAAFHLPETKAMPWQLSLVRDTWLGALLVRGLNAFARGAAVAACTRRRLPQELRDAYCAPYDSWDNRIATLRFVQDIPLKPGDSGYEIVSEVEQRLPELADRPALICWGDKDFVFDHHFLERWRQLLPKAEVHRFADCGHYVLEDAGEEIAALVEEFLEANPLEPKEAPAGDGAVS